MPAASRQRSTRRRQQDRLAAEKLRRDARQLARMAEVPALALSSVALYRLEVAKRRAQGKPVLRTPEELRRATGEWE
jgi:hypothetical protein